jgi:single-strand DNA-binding protein
VNAVNLIGRLAGDPRQRRSGSPRTTLRLSVARRGAEDAGDLYVDVVTYGDQAMAVAAELRRGRLVAVTGRLEQREVEAGDTRSPYFVVASEVDFLPVAVGGSTVR